MSNWDKFNEAAERISRLEARLKEEDFSSYTLDALDFERDGLNKIWEKFESLYESCSIDPAEKKKETASIHTKFNQIQKISIRCVNLIARARRRINKEESSEPEPVGPKRGNSLPIQACEVEVFDGTYSAWPTFRDLFTAIYINNERLDPVAKLCCLFQKTTGDARAVNANISITAENFEVAWENLSKEYENRRVLFNEQMTALCFGSMPRGIRC